MPSPESNGVTHQQCKSLRDWRVSDIMRFFNIDARTWADFRKNKVSPFYNQHVKDSMGLAYFDRSAIARDTHFLRFEQEVLTTYSWASRDGIDLVKRRDVLVQAVHVAFINFRDLSRKSRKAERIVGTPVISSTRSTVVSSGIKIESGISNTKATPKSSSNDENSLISDDDEKEIEEADVFKPDILEESLHVRIIRQWNSIHHPTLAYQTFVRALQKDATNRINILDHLNYKKLQDCAVLYLGFDIKKELLAVDYGSKRKPEWLFVQDDASLCSTIQTWHAQYPKVARVEVMVVERPGFIPYRSPSAVIAGVVDQDMDEEDDEDEDGEEEDSQAEEDEVDEEMRKEDDDGHDEDDQSGANDEEDEDMD